MTKLNELKEKITEAVPEIMELKFGCEIETETLKYKHCKSCYQELREEKKEIIWSINYFIKQKKDEIYLFNYLDNFQRIDIKEVNLRIIGRPITLEDVLVAEKTNLVINRMKIVEKWQLNKSLSEQSKETIDFLHKLLITNI